MFEVSSNCCQINITSSYIQIHDSDAPWKTYLVVLEGNVEDKKSKTPTKGTLEKAAAGERKKTAKKSLSGGGTAAVAAAAVAGSSGKTLTDSIVVPAEPVTLSSEWTTHGAIAVVSHGTAGGITVIHTEVPRGAQLQPIVTAGASVISLDGSAIPFSVAMAPPVPLSSEASAIALSVPAVSVPVSDGAAVSVSEIPTVSTPCVLEAAASQTILAQVSESEAPSESYVFQSESVTVGDEVCGKDKTATEQQRTADTPLTEPKGAVAPDSV